jgi:hypothetical protein
MEPDGKGGFTHADDLQKLTLLGKIPGVGAGTEMSNRMYATAANTMRTQLFDMMMKQLGDPNGKDLALARDIAKQYQQGVLGTVVLQSDSASIKRYANLDIEDR